MWQEEEQRGRRGEIERTERRNREDGEEEQRGRGGEIERRERRDRGEGEEGGGGGGGGRDTEIIR